MILVCGAGGFIGGHLVRKLLDDGKTVRAVDKKPKTEWYQLHDEAQNIVLDLSDEANCRLACNGVDEVYQLAADMGGMGFIEKFRIECMRSVLINVHMLESAQKAGVKKYFYSSSACAYNVDKQQEVTSRGLKESDAYPANAERGYGWEKLYSEMLGQEYVAERGMEVYIARFHNVYGPNGTWRGGREKAPAALCRKVATVVETEGSSMEVWGDGKRVRTYMFIDDCIMGIQKIMGCSKLIGKPINLGSEERMSVDGMIDEIESAAGICGINRVYQPDAPKGVVGRASDNTMIREILGWEPSTSFHDGIKITYDWIHQQVINSRSGKKVLD
jgi:nucleoside-diphosphate-sugar epimerase